MPPGMLEQHRAIAFSRIEITRQERDRAGPLPEDAAKSEGVTTGPAFLHVVLDDAQGLVRKAEQPQDPRLKVARRDPQVEAETNDLGPCREVPKARQGSSDVVIRQPLVAEKVQRGRKKPIS